MKNDNIIEKFQELKTKYPAHGRIPCLASVIRGKKLPKKQIKKYLNHLCQPEQDFFKEEQSLIVNWLYEVSNRKNEKNESSKIKGL